MLYHGIVYCCFFSSAHQSTAKETSIVPAGTHTTQPPIASAYDAAHPGPAQLFQHALRLLFTAPNNRTAGRKQEILGWVARAGDHSRQAVDTSLFEVCVSSLAEEVGWVRYVGFVLNYRQHHDDVLLARHLTPRHVCCSWVVPFSALLSGCPFPLVLCCSLFFPNLVPTYLRSSEIRPPHRHIPTTRCPKASQPASQPTAHTPRRATPTTCHYSVVRRTLFFSSAKFFLVFLS